MSFRALALVVALAILPGCGVGPLNAAKAAGGALGASAAKKKPPTDKFERPKAEAAELINAGLCFRLMDRNGDTKLEPLEWAISDAAVAAGAPGFKDADLDLDKAVSAFEWTTFARPRFAGKPWALVDIAAGFKEADKDEGRKLTPEEFNQFVKALPGEQRDALYLETKSISDWMLGADKNHDYALDQPELEALLASLMLRRLGDVDR